MRFRRSGTNFLPISVFLLTPCLLMPIVFLMSQRIAHGAAIRAIREATGVSISAFAPRCDVSQGYMSHVELGTKQPTVEVMRRIADQLGVSLDAVSYVMPSCGHEEAAA